MRFSRNSSLKEFTDRFYLSAAFKIFNYELMYSGLLENLHNTFSDVIFCCRVLNANEMLLAVFNLVVFYKIINSFPIYAWNHLKITVYGVCRSGSKSDEIHQEYEYGKISIENDNLREEIISISKFVEFPINTTVSGFRKISIVKDRTKFTEQSSLASGSWEPFNFNSKFISWCFIWKCL